MKFLYLSCWQWWKKRQNVLACHVELRLLHTSYQSQLGQVLPRLTRASSFTTYIVTWWRGYILLHAWYALALLVIFFLEFKLFFGNFKTKSIDVLPQRVTQNLFGSGYTRVPSLLEAIKVNLNDAPGLAQIHIVQGKVFCAQYEPPRHLPNKFSRCPFSFMALRKYIK